MRFKLTEAFNDDMNNAINKKTSLRLGEITQADIDRLNDDFMEDIGTDGLEETLNKKSSLAYHFKKHTLKANEPRRSGNRNKYDAMSISDYYDYAIYVSTLSPTNIVDNTITDKDDISDIVNDFIISGTVLKIDYNLKNKTDQHDMIAIFNKNSKYSRYIDLCLFDTSKNEPITVFPVLPGRFTKYINDFLGI